MNFFTDEMRRNPWPVYDQMRTASPAFRVPPPFDAWMIFDYEGVKRVLHDNETFSSRVPGPRHWFIFLDPPIHTKLRALISKAFTPQTIANLEPRIRELSRQLLDPHIEHGTIDLAVDYSIPLPMRVIAGMIGIPESDWAQFASWSDSILKLSHTRSGGEEAAGALAEFKAVTEEMKDYLAAMLKQPKPAPPNDLLWRLADAEVDGERLSSDDILGFFQLLILGGQETTTNLINNAVLSLLENPDQLALLRETPSLLRQTIEEVLRFRSPLQWIMRTPRHAVEMHGHTIPAGNLVLAMIGSANRDPGQFRNPNSFDISREPTAHLAFGHGIHFCLGAALARLEAKIALTDILANLRDLERLDDQPWEPRKAYHVYGPSSLPLRFKPAQWFG